MPPRKNAIKKKWVYKIKYKLDGSIYKYKVLLVTKDYAQFEGIDYNKIITLVSRLGIIRFIIDLTTKQGWIVYQMDAKSSFLNGYTNDGIYS